MTELFLKIVNMSISASWLVLAVLALRLFLKKAPKWSIVTLWGIVAARLLFPFSIESALSLIPSAQTVTPEIMTDTAPTIQSGVPIINNTVNSIISQTLAPATENSVNPLEVLIPALAVAWALGIILLLGYTAVSALSLRIKIGTAVRLSGNVYQSEYVKSPFVMGIIMPKIYVPFNMDGEAAELIIAHEQSHLRRKDHWWKPLGFLLLTVHWFNPLMWIAYAALCKDIELACDERVIKGFDNEKRADYSKTLLEYSVNRGAVTACPLAFGEVGVRARVKSVLNYKKPAFWLIALSLVICIAIGVCFLTDPIDKGDAQLIYGSAASWPPLKEVQENYSWIDARDNGYIVLYKNDIISGEKGWINFVNATYSGRSDIVRVFQNDGSQKNIRVYELSFDGEKYYLKYYDNDEKRLIQSEYQYLIRGISTGDNFNYENFWLTEANSDGTPVLWTSSGANSNGYLICSAKNNYFDSKYHAEYGSAYADIDGDGVDERCFLGEDKTADTPTFTIAVFHSGWLKYYNTFESDFNYLSFIQDENGKLMVREVMRGAQPEIHLYDIVYTYGDKVELMENGEIIKSYQ